MDLGLILWGIDPDDVIALASLIGLYLVAGFILWLYFHMRSIRDKFDHVERMAMIENGGRVSAEVLGSLRRPLAGRERDLRAGLIWLGAGIGYIGAGVFIEGLRPYWSIGLFPAVIGLAHLLYVGLGSKKVELPGLPLSRRELVHDAVEKIATGRKEGNGVLLAPTSSVGDAGTDPSEMER